MERQSEAAPPVHSVPGVLCLSSASPVRGDFRRKAPEGFSSPKPPLKREVAQSAGGVLPFTPLSPAATSPPFRRDRKASPERGGGSALLTRKGSCWAVARFHRTRPPRGLPTALLRTTSGAPPKRTSYGVAAHHLRGAPQEDFLRCRCAPPPRRSRHEAAENQWKRTLFRS